MFVPVACNQCGKPFQVAEADAGKSVTCPWCRATVPALPVAETKSENRGLTPPARQDPVEPLSLDDETPGLGERGASAPCSPGSPRARFPVRTVAVVFGLMLVVAAGTVLALGYGAGRVPESAWREFSPPDGSCAVLLPGTPAATAVDPDPTIPGTRGGQWFATRGWYSRAEAWLGWWDLDPGWAKQAAADRDGAVTAPVLAAVIARRKEQLGGTVVKEARARFNAYPGIEVLRETPRGPAVERLIVVPDGPRPRLYSVGFRAKEAAPDSPVVQRLFNSFRVNRE